MGSLVILFFVLPMSSMAREFPEWRVAPIGFSGAWELASSVAVGYIGPARPLGVQWIKRAPKPVFQDEHTIHWCEADFHTIEMVRGRKLQSKQRYVWGSVSSGCIISGKERGHAGTSEDITEVWLLRAEGSVLRPVVDVGGRFFVKLHTTWQKGIDPIEQFGRFLLTPRALNLTDDELADSFFFVAERGCQVLGRSRCVDYIRNISMNGSPALRNASCRYLRLQLQIPCK